MCAFVYVCACVCMCLCVYVCACVHVCVLCVCVVCVIIHCSVHFKKSTIKTTQATATVHDSSAMVCNGQWKACV